MQNASKRKSTESANPTNSSPTKAVRQEKTHDFLLHTHVKDVLKETKENIVVLEHNTTVGDGLHELAKQNILSAPVVLSASALEDDESGTYMGMFDIRDMLTRIIDDVDHSGEEKKKDWTSLNKIGETILAKKLITVCNDHDVELMFRTLEGTTVNDLISDAFLHKGKGGQSVHRVALFDGKGQIDTVISQSDVVKFIAHNISHLGDLRGKTIEELDMGTKNVVTVCEGTIAIDGFHQMKEKDVSCVGVVDKEGKLVNNLSASDLRGLTGKDFGKLTLIISTFRIAMGKDAPIITCSSTDTLETVVEKVSSNHVHRIYVVDESGKPLRVITLTDILRLLIEA